MSHFNGTLMNHYVNATNVLFGSLEQVSECKDKDRARNTIDLIQDYLLQIYELRDADGKCRVTTGMRDKYVSLLTQIGGDKAAKIVSYLIKAQEVGEDFEEMDDLFDKK